MITPLNKLRIDNIVSDVVCPWCIIGYRHSYKRILEQIRDRDDV